MVKDAEQHADDDKSKREQVETRNKADALAYETEKLLKEHGAKIDPAKKARVESALEKVKSLLKDGDAAAIQAAMEALNTEMQAVSTDLYAQAKSSRQAGGAAEAGGAGREAPKGGEESAPGGGKSSKNDGNVIDADFEMVDDKK